MKINSRSLSVNFLVPLFHGTTGIEAVTDFVSYTLSISGVTVSTVSVICCLRSSRLLG
jgi:hypothetical protein